MDEVLREVEMRIAGVKRPGCLEDVRKAIQAIDPGAQVRLDADTGILHTLIRRETLEVTDALTRAGFEVSAVSGG